MTSTSESARSAGTTAPRLQAHVSCRDVLGRRHTTAVLVRGGHEVMLRVPLGESVTFSADQASDLAEIIAAASRRVPAQAPSSDRPIAVFESFSIVRRRDGWVVHCHPCEPPAGYPEHDLSVHATCREAEAAAAEHWAQRHEGDPV